MRGEGFIGENRPGIRLMRYLGIDDPWRRPQNVGKTPRATVARHTGDGQHMTLGSHASWMHRRFIRYRQTAGQQRVATNATPMNC